MKSTSTIAQLYYIILKALRQETEKMKAVTNTMITMEGLNSELFHNELDRLNSSNNSPKVYNEECAHGFKNMHNSIALRFVAWICIIANQDGFMPNHVWKTIFNFYAVELKQDVSKLIEEQKILKNAMKQYDLIML